jgi:hypothetical protein
MRTYSENSSLKGNWEDLTPEDFEFINIQELINFGTLATIVKRDKDTFFTFLNQLGNSYQIIVNHRLTS